MTGVSADTVLNPQTVSAFNPESPNYLLVPAAELQLPEFNASYPPAMLLVRRLLESGFGERAVCVRYDGH